MVVGLVLLKVLRVASDSQRWNSLWQLLFPLFDISPAGWILLHAEPSRRRRCEGRRSRTQVYEHWTETNRGSEVTFFTGKKHWATKDETITSHKQDEDSSNSSQSILRNVNRIPFGIFCNSKISKLEQIMKLNSCIVLILIWLSSTAYTVKN